MTKDLFVSSIKALRDQFDKDLKRATELSQIYGSDINPNNNMILISAIIDLLQASFKPSKEGCKIEHFCFDQDFGRAVNKSITDLWDELSLLEIPVTYTYITGTDPYFKKDNT